MNFLAIFAVFFLHICRVAGTRSASPRTSIRRHSRVIESRDESKTWVLADMYTGYGFLDGWDFFTGPDPTNGLVIYQNKTDAIAKGLFIVQPDGTTVLAVDDKTFLPVGAKRDSVRISTKKKFNGGLFIANIYAAPGGCSVWPAWWSVGPNWPAGGELDIYEGVHDQTTNLLSVHTTPGCTLSTDNVPVTGKITDKDCSGSNNSNAGCGFIDGDTRTYGNGFNNIGGGVYAHLWNSAGIKVWHFARNEIPADITNETPNPSSWGAPVAFWSASSCNIAAHFYEHSLVLDTTLCGDFGAATFSASGCPGSCAETVTDPKNYLSAKWKINYIAVYQ